MGTQLTILQCVLTNFLYYYFSKRTSYKFAKYSDFPKMKNFSDLGYNKIMPCRHVYEYIGQDICPDCGRYTHETDTAFQRQLHKQWIEDGKHLSNQCPQGGTIRGWWDI